MDGMDGSPVPVPERGVLPSPASLPAVFCWELRQAGRERISKSAACSLEQRGAMEWGGGFLQSTRGTPGRFPMGSGVLCVDRGGEMVLSSPASALPHL